MEGAPGGGKPRSGVNGKQLPVARELGKAESTLGGIPQTPWELSSSSHDLALDMG